MGVAGTFNLLMDHRVEGLYIVPTLYPTRPLCYSNKNDDVVTMILFSFMLMAKGFF